MHRDSFSFDFVIKIVGRSSVSIPSVDTTVLWSTILYIPADCFYSDLALCIIPCSCLCMVFFFVAVIGPSSVQHNVCEPLIKKKVPSIFMCV